MESKIMRCPFRKGENGEFAECYGEGCMAYFSVPFYGCGTDGPSSSPMCRKLIAQSPPMQIPQFTSYQQFPR